MPLQPYLLLVQLDYPLRNTPDADPVVATGDALLFLCPNVPQEVLVFDARSGAREEQDLPVLVLTQQESWSGNTKIWWYLEQSL
jgi:hypothetical protein